MQHRKLRSARTDVPDINVGNILLANATDEIRKLLSAQDIITIADIFRLFCILGGCSLKWERFIVLNTREHLLRLDGDSSGFADHVDAEDSRSNHWRGRLNDINRHLQRSKYPLRVHIQALPPCLRQSLMYQHHSIYPSRLPWVQSCWREHKRSPFQQGSRFCGCACKPISMFPRFLCAFFLRDAVFFRRSGGV